MRACQWLSATRGAAHTGAPAGVGPFLFAPISGLSLAPAVRAPGGQTGVARPSRTPSPGQGRGADGGLAEPGQAERADPLTMAVWVGLDGFGTPRLGRPARGGATTAGLGFGVLAGHQGVEGVCYREVTLVAADAALRTQTHTRLDTGDGSSSVK